MFQRQLFASMEFFLEQHGYKTQFFSSLSDASEASLSPPPEKRDARWHSFIHELDNPRLYQYIRKEASCRPLHSKSRNSVSPRPYREEHSASLAVEYLIQRDTPIIGFITGDISALAASARMATEALARTAFIQPSLRCVTLLYPGADAGLLTLIKRKQPLTAVFAATDELAIGAMKALSESGLRVPEDVSVVGLDDIDISAFTTPGLTTVRQPIFEMGKKSADLVCEWIARGRMQEKTELFTATIVERDSVRTLN